MKNGNTKEKKILVFVRYYLPGYRSGGPVRSVSNFVSSLSDEFNFRIVCLDRDLGAHERYKNVQTGVWNKHENSNIMYLKKKPGLFLIKTLIDKEKPDLIYLNSLFDFHFSIKIILLKLLNKELRVVLATRGELSPGALKLKPVKKNLFIFLAKIFGLYDTVSWHASSAVEKKLIEGLKLGKAQKIYIAANLPSRNKFQQICHTEKEVGHLKVVLPARISRMKNTAKAISLIGRLSGNISLDLIGPIEDVEYWQECKKEISLISEGTCISYLGERTHKELLKEMGSYHLLFLPTLGENFGHSIAEAFSLGVPVVISDQTPWRNLQKEGVGFDLPLDEEEKILKALECFRDMDSKSYSIMRNRCFEYFDNWCSSNAKLFAYRDMFNDEQVR